MPAIVKIDGYDLFQYLRVAPGEGLDPTNSSFAQPQFAEAAIGDGQPLVSISDGNKELAWPLHLNPARVNIFQDGIDQTAEEFFTSSVDGATIVGTGWNLSATSVTTNTSEVSTDWSFDGYTKTLHFILTKDATATSRFATVYAPNTGTSGHVVTGNSTYQFTCSLKVVDAPTTGTWRLQLYWYDSGGTIISTTNSNIMTATGNTGEFYNLRIAAQAPSNAAFCAAAIDLTSWTTSADQIEYYVGAPRLSVLTPTKDSLHDLLININKRLKTADYLEWRDEDATDSTFYKVQYARFEADYNYRRAEAKWLSGMLRVWVKPYGYRASGDTTPSAYTLVASRVPGSLGMPLMVTPTSSVDGDADALLGVFLPMATSVALSGGAVWPSGGLLGYSVMYGHETGFYGASPIAALGGGTTIAATSGIASLAARTAFGGTNPAVAALIQVSPSKLEPGRHHLIGIGRSFATNGASGLIIETSHGLFTARGIATSYFAASTHWRLIDLGVYDHSDQTTSEHNINDYVGVYIRHANGTSGSPTCLFEMTGMYCLPEDRTVYTRAQEESGAFPISLKVNDDSGVIMESSSMAYPALLRGNPPRWPLGNASQWILGFANFDYVNQNRQYDSRPAQIYLRERFTYAR